MATVMILPSRFYPHRSTTESPLSRLILEPELFLT